MWSASAQASRISIRRNISRTLRQGARGGFHQVHTRRGIPELRQASRIKFKRDNGLSYKPSQIVVSCGGKHSCYNVYPGNLPGRR